MKEKLLKILRKAIDENQFIDGDTYELTDEMLEEPVQELMKIIAPLEEKAWMYDELE